MVASLWSSTTEAEKSLEALRRAAGRSAPSGAAAQQEAAVAARKQREALQRRAAEVQAEKVRALRDDFARLAGMTDKQERGYAFERFLADLFKASDLDYRGSYKVGAQQIDGAFKHGGRDYLVEARWREEPPAANDLFTFAMKATGKLDGTLGLFITMVPPRDEVLVDVAKASRNVLIMDGGDLVLILEGRLTNAAGSLGVQAQACRAGGHSLFKPCPSSPGLIRSDGSARRA